MARLNTSKTQVRVKKVAEETTTNYAGAVAYKIGAHSKLIEQVVGAFWNENLYYAKGNKIAKEIINGVKEVAKTDPKFPLQLAAYARNVLYLRTTPQVLLVEAARINECKPFVEEYTQKIVKRADELTEVVAYYSEHYGKGNGGSTHKNFPNALKRGLAKAFLNFDEYQLNKYDSSKSSVSLGQVAQLVHPAIGKAMYNYLTRGEVDPEALPKIAKAKAILARDSIEGLTEDEIRSSGLTWENFISKFGSSKETWEFIIPQMGYMALLRNLRNFDQKGVNLDPVLKRITDQKEIERSKQLPFRFFSAYKQMENQKIERAVAQAFEKSITNVTLPGKTAVIVDLSGSMETALSEKSKVSYKEMAAVLGAIAIKKSDESVFIGFADTVARKRLNPDDTMMTNVKSIVKTDVGYSTNAWLAFDGLPSGLDRVILISDMQCYDTRSGYWNTYSQHSVQDKWAAYVKANPNAHLFSLDVSAYGTSQTQSNAKNVVLLNGWSDKIIDLINLHERGNVMVEEVRKY